MREGPYTLYYCSGPATKCFMNILLISCTSSMSDIQHAKLVMLCCWRQCAGTTLSSFQKAMWYQGYNFLSCTSIICILHLETLSLAHWFVSSKLLLPPPPTHTPVVFRVYSFLALYSRITADYDMGYWKSNIRWLHVRQAPY